MRRFVCSSWRLPAEVRLLHVLAPVGWRAYTSRITLATPTMTAKKVITVRGTAFEKAAREFDKFSEHIKQVHSRSYLSERDPLMDRPRPVGLKSFLDGNERAGYGWR